MIAKFKRILLEKSFEPLKYLALPRVFMDKVKLSLGDVARISLNRPEKKNALDKQLLVELKDALDAVKNSKASVLVLTGEGDTFCSGLDRNLLMGLVKGEMDEKDLRKAIDLVQEIIFDIRTMKIPVIAAVKRYAIGGGLQLALAADIRIATPGTIFSVKELDFGIIPDMGALYILPRIVGDGVARDMIYTRREIRAEEAKILGLVNEIYEDLEKGIDEYTKKLLSVPNFALREAKMLIEKGWNQNFKENLLDTKEAQVRCVMEAVGKFKR